MPLEILCVEDDDITSRLLSQVLRKAGFNVRLARNGAVALDMLTNRATDPKLIIMDVNMPEMDGFELCSQLQADKRFANIPVVFLTSRVTEGDKFRAFQAGALDFISKPFQKEKLLTTVARHLATPKDEQSKPKRIMTASAAKTQPLDEQALIVAVGAKSKPKTDNLYSVLPEFFQFKSFLLQKVGIDAAEGKNYAIQPRNLYEDVESQLGLSAEALSLYISEFTRIPFLDVIDPSGVELGVLPPPFCRKYQVIPYRDHLGGQAFIVSHPFHLELQDALRRFRKADLYIAYPLSIQAIFQPQQENKLIVRTEDKKKSRDLTGVLDELKDLYIPPFKEEQKVDAPTEEELEMMQENDKPMIRLVNGLIENGHSLGASDIHIEPQEDHVAIRYRVDGELRTTNQLKPLALINPIVARLKIMSNLDISEKRLPQDGRIVFKDFTHTKLDFDLRVATAPMNYGEKVVMRIIDKQKATLPLENLGFSKPNLALYREKIKTPYGMILHVGPTGSGKSMTLYSALSDIQRPGINIQTAEDPIEYTLPGINQLQVRSDIGLTFSKALRSYLRQDPDIILVGEIRDRETAHIAVEAAMTGHLLFSTLHTNDAAGTIIRLTEMGIEPYLVNSTLNLICAQRLIRRVCNQCKQPYEPIQAERDLLGLGPDDRVLLHRAKGCKECQQSGYKGRIGIHEILAPNDVLRQAMVKPGVSADELKKLAVTEAGMTTLYWDAIGKTLKGLTTLDEVLTHIKRDDFDSRPQWLLELLGKSSNG